jgi:mRNA interferase RelE/StbE
MSYTVLIKSSAKKELKRIDYQMHDRIMERIVGLQENPRPMGSEKLEGRHNSYRIRIVDYRIAFTIDDKARTVEIIKVGDRKEVYKKR